MSGNSLGPSPRAAVFLAFSALAGVSVARLFEKWHGINTNLTIGGFEYKFVGFVFLVPVATANKTMVTILASGCNNFFSMPFTR